jgi:hypothetical protein
VHDISTGETTQLSTEAGDQDCDWEVDLADAILTLDVIGGEDYPERCSSADLDGDGQLSLKEALYPLQHLADMR